MKLTDLKMHDTVRSFLRTGPKTGPKIVVGDIETFPTLSYHFSHWNTNIADEAVLEDQSLMSSAFKWLDQPDAFYIDQSGFGKRMRNDTKQLRIVREVLHEADFLVAHNGKKFDLRMLRAFMALRGLTPFRPVKVIDTYQLNKSVFGFEKQSLKWTSKRLTDTKKDEHKEFPGFKLWMQCLLDNPAAWDECRVYNLTDITSCEEMYLKVRGWYERHPNLGPYVIPEEEGEHVCPNCGSTDVRLAKPNRHTDVGTYHQYQCRACDKYSRGRYLTRNKEQRAHILVG